MAKNNGRLFGRLIKALVVVILLFLAAASIVLLSAYKEFKGTALAGKDAKTDLEQAIAAMQAKNWDEAEEKAQSANDKLDESLKYLENIRKKPSFKGRTLLSQQVDDLEYLFKTGEVLSRSLKRLIPILREADEIRSGGANDFSALSDSQKGKFLELIYKSEPELNGLKANLELARLNLDKIHEIGVLWPIYGKIADIKNELTWAAGLMDQSLPLAKLLPLLAGYPESSRFLIIFQNNDELRPGGGFIGVYGVMVTKNGSIEELNSEDSYHVDMPAIGKWQKEPPLAISKYMKLENWWFRDSNWSPDWKLSAENAQNFFVSEKKAIGQDPGSFQGVIGITPGFVEDLLAIVGPISVDGQTYQPENFQELLQYNVEMAYKDKNISEWDRKKIVNDLMSELKQKLFALPPARWPEVIAVLSDNLKEKNLLLYFNDQNRQLVAEALGAAGRVDQSYNQDYLMIVDANLAAFKSDSVMKKGIEYNLKSENDELKAELKLKYKHEGGFDWRTTRYRSYTRVYVPAGSRLQKIDGLDWVQNDCAVTNFDADTQKTVFSFFFQVEPGDERDIVISYYLPEDLKKKFLAENYYRLMIQKQAGRRTDYLRASVDLDKTVTQSSDNIYMSADNQTASFKSDLSQDSIISLQY